MRQQCVGFDLTTKWYAEVVCKYTWRVVSYIGEIRGTYAIDKINHTITINPLEPLAKEYNIAFERKHNIIKKTIVLRYVQIYLSELNSEGVI